MGASHVFGAKHHALRESVQKRGAPNQQARLEVWGNRPGTTGSSVETLAFRLRLSSAPEAPGYSMSLYVDHTGEPQVDHTSEPLPSWLFARVPCEVVCDRSLKPLDIRVYCMLAGSVWQGATAKIGTRLNAAPCQHKEGLMVRAEMRQEAEKPPRENPGGEQNGCFWGSTLKGIAAFSVLSLSGVDRQPHLLPDGSGQEPRTG
jgi:hypothetical protein